MSASFTSLGLTPLNRLDLGKGLDPVPKDGRPLKIQPLRSVLHFNGKLLLHPKGLARKEPLRILHHFPVLLLGNLADARRAAALDLVEQAGSAPVGEHGIRTVPEEKDLLQLAQGPAHGLSRCEWTEIASLLRFRPAVFPDLREPMGP